MDIAMVLCVANVIPASIGTPELAMPVFDGLRLGRAVSTAVLVSLIFATITPKHPIPGATWEP
jgi:hypothetical protein